MLIRRNVSEIKIIDKINQLKELKFQTCIRTKGYTLHDFQVHFSRNSKTLTADELSSVFKRIMKAISNANAPSLKLIVHDMSTLSVIGHLTPKVADLNAK